MQIDVKMVNSSSIEHGWRTDNKEKTTEDKHRTNGILFPVPLHSFFIVSELQQFWSYDLVTEQTENTVSEQANQTFLSKKSHCFEKHYCHHLFGHWYNCVSIRAPFLRIHYNANPAVSDLHTPEASLETLRFRGRTLSLGGRTYKKLEKRLCFAATWQEKSTQGNQVSLIPCPNYRNQVSHLHDSLVEKDGCDRTFIISKIVTGLFHETTTDLPKLISLNSCLQNERTECMKMSLNISECLKK